MALVEKGDLLRVNGKIALADSSDYKKLVFSVVGTHAVDYVNIVYPETWAEDSVPVKDVEKL
jgi:hypothetical protein